jgi:hypothetical protein
MTTDNIMRELSADELIAVSGGSQYHDHHGAGRAHALRPRGCRHGDARAAADSGWPSALTIADASPDAKRRRQTETAGGAGGRRPAFFIMK